MAIFIQAQTRNNYNGSGTDDVFKSIYTTIIKKHKKLFRKRFRLAY